METVTRKPNIDGLDLWKAAAATLIVFHHYQQSFDCTFSGINFSGGSFYFGYLVELFFLISGFLTVYTDKHPSKSLKNRVGGVFSKLLRLLPLAAVVCVFALAVKTVTASVTGNGEQMAWLWNWKTLVANFLLIFRGWPFFSMSGINNPTWYLCILVQCYLIYYLLTWLLDRVRIPRWTGFALCAGLALAAGRTGLVQTETYRGVECFFLGAVGCQILESRSAEKVLEKPAARRWICIGSAMIVAVAAALIVRHSSFQRPLLILGVFPWLILVAYCLRNRENRMIRFFGKASFAVFVCHSPLIALEKLILLLTGAEVGRSYGTMILFAGITWLVGCLVYRFVETPIAKRIKAKERAGRT